MEEEKFYCPVNGWDCPYYQKNGTCTCEDVANSCEDYMMMEECFADDDINNIYIFDGDLDCGFDPYLGCYTDDC